MSKTGCFDVIIVGAGPAGLSTALHLQRYAPDLIPRTLVLEKARHPRHKLCGGGILPDAEHILLGLGLDVSDIPHVDVSWANFDYDGQGIKMRVEKRADYAFRTIRRNEFDAWLAERARQRGIQIQENSAVNGIELNDTSITLFTSRGEYQAAVVVGADGSNSVIRRSIAHHQATHTARLLEVVTESKPDISIHAPQESRLDFRFVPSGIQGYVWDFPALERGKPVRVRGVYDSNIHRIRRRSSLRQALEDEFKRQGLNLDSYRLESHPIRGFDSRGIFSTRRILLVGDAAGVDSLFGEGISPALGYGEIAARAILDAFTRADFTFSDYRLRLMRHELGQSLNRRAWFAKVFYSLRSRRIQRLLWQRLGPVIVWIVRTYLIGWSKRQYRTQQMYKFPPNGPSEGQS